MTQGHKVTKSQSHRISYSMRSRQLSAISVQKTANKPRVKWPKGQRFVYG